MFDLKLVRGAGKVLEPASQTSIDAARAALGTLPRDLESLWKQCDGMLLNSGVKIYETSEIIERNQAYHVEENAKGYVLIGDDSGGRALLMSRTEGAATFICDMGFLDLDYFHPVADDFESWISAGARLEGDDATVFDEATDYSPIK